MIPKMTFEEFKQFLKRDVKEAKVDYNAVQMAIKAKDFLMENGADIDVISNHDHGDGSVGFIISRNLQHVYKNKDGQIITIKSQKDINEVLWDVTPHPELTDPEHNLAYLIHQVYKIESTKYHETEDSFRKAYEDSQKANQYISTHYDFKKLRVGFNVFTGDGVIWHTIQFSHFDLVI